MHIGKVQKIIKCIQIGELMAKLCIVYLKLCNRIHCLQDDASHIQYLSDGYNGAHSQGSYINVGTEGKYLPQQITLKQQLSVILSEAAESRILHKLFIFHFKQRIHMIKTDFLSRFHPVEQTPQVINQSIVMIVFLTELFQQRTVLLCECILK